MKLLLPALLASAASASTLRGPAAARVLSKARRLNGDGEQQWMPGYSLRFEKCATSTDYYGGYFGGNQDNQNQNQANFNGMYEQRLVHFKLCPSGACGSGCSGGGDYVVDMNDFVAAYLEYQEEAKEAACEAVQENCDCENANDDEMCELQCYKSAGLYSQCVEEDQQQNNGNDNGQNQGEEFDLQEAMECQRLDVDQEAAQYYNYQNGGGNNNNQAQQYNYQGQNGNYNYNQQQEQEVEFFVGPFCARNGKSIHLGVFLDETCSFAAPSGTYEKFNYGRSLPYASTSIVTNECISCMQPVEENNDADDENNNNGNGNNNNQEQEQPETLEFCAQLYEDAGKCETDMTAYGMYPTTLACSFIAGLNPWGKERISASISNAAHGVTDNATPQILAGVFAATTVILGGVAYYMHKRVQRNTVGLAASGTVMA